MVHNEPVFGSAALIVHNAALAPTYNASLMDAAARINITIIFDSAYAGLPTSGELNTLRNDRHLQRQELGMFVHFVPADVGRMELNPFRIHSYFLHDHSYVSSQGKDDILSDDGGLLERWLDVT